MSAVQSALPGFGQLHADVSVIEVESPHATSVIAIARQPELVLLPPVDSSVELPILYWSAIKMTKSGGRRGWHFATEAELKSASKRFTPERLNRAKLKLDQLVQAAASKQQIEHQRLEVYRCIRWLMMSQQIPADEKFLLDRRLDLTNSGCDLGGLGTDPNTGQTYVRSRTTLSRNAAGAPTEFYYTWRKATFK